VPVIGFDEAMNKSSWIVVAAVGAGLLAACQEQESESTSGRNRYGYQGTAAGTEFATPTPAPEATPPVQETTQAPAPQPTPQPQVAPTRDIPYATPVPGKPGFVTSPFAAYAGYVDVRGYPPGTEVKCPYTQKIFLVP